MTKHTPGAVKAAEKMWDDEKAHGILMDRAEYIKVLATIIDQETGLPALKSRIDWLEAENKQVKGLIAGNLKQIGELKHYLHERGEVIASLEAEKAELRKVMIETLKSLRLVWGMDHAVKTLETALAKAEPPATTNPKPEEQ